MARTTPPTFTPMLATLARAVPPDGERWAYEMKWDGYRMLGYATDGGLRLLSRRSQDYTHAYPAAAGLAAALRGHTAVVDGELCAVVEGGRTDFQALQNLIGPHPHPGESDGTHIAYILFDLLWFDGESLVRLPYTERRARLESLDLDADGWCTPPYQVGDGARLLAVSRDAGQEGVMAKLLDSPYRPGDRSREWLKVKNHRRQEFVIAGWTPGAGTRQDRIGSLLLAYREGGEYVYAGRVGTGFNRRMLDDLAALLAPLRRDGRTVRGGAPPRGSVFVEPRLVCEVEFWEWTRDGEIRHPSFKGLREDKRAEDVLRERET